MGRRHLKKLINLVATIAIGIILFPPFLAAGQGRVLTLSIDGSISPANADYFSRGLAEAVDTEADLLLLHLNTPGGLDKSMRMMIQGILDSPIPVVVYVSPKGARAASAGTYLMYASHVAAMAPATNMGSATPVSIGLTKPLPPNRNEGKDETVDTINPDVMHQKMINDAEAYLLSLAELRGRSQKWARKAVRDAANLTAKNALVEGVIDIIAYDQTELINKLHRREIDLGQKKATLHLVDPEIIDFKTDWRTDLLIVITDPSIAYLLLLAGVYGLMFEFLHPGGLLAGTIGAICLLLGLYALNMLPISYTGLALLFLGIALMISEAIAPSFGILGLGGISSLVIGSFMLMDSSLPGYQIAPALIISSALASGFITIFVLSMILKARKKPLVSGVDALVSHSAVAVADFEGNGRVMIRGEVWRAECDLPIRKDEKVRVLSVEGLVLKVAKED